MAQRSFSVVVLPDEWDGSLEELAQKMRPVTRRGPNQMLPLLARGATTVEADLSVEEAGLLQARLNKLGVPARVVDENGETVSNSAHVASESAPEAADEPEPSETSKSEKPKKPSLRLPKPKKQRESEPTPAEPSTSGEWAELLPGIDEAGEEEEPADTSEPSAPSAPTEAQPPSLDELAGDFGAEPADADVDAEADANPNPPTPKPQPQPKSPGPRAERPNPQPPTSNPQRPSFDAGKMSSALRSKGGDKPPYAPEGFDDNLEHIPLLAALLSLVAPGAGQIYNGQEERGREFAVRFPLVMPWYHSVKQAFERAEQIRTYWAPRPEPGALRDALKFMMIWWIIVGGVVTLLGWTGSQIYQMTEAPEEPQITEADVRRAVSEATTHVQMARIGGLDGVTEYLDERNRTQERFTMSEKERAERLFRRGLEYCEQGNFATCESAMKRVSSLSPRLRRKAFKLQAWASVRQSGEVDEPMPDVGEVESLEEFERASEPPAVDSESDDSEPDPEESEDTNAPPSSP